MVKKYSLAKKLASYSALAAGVLAVSHDADAQIVYTDLNPGVIIPNPIQFKSNYDTSAYLDLNNDGISDFQFIASGQHNKSSFSSYIYGNSYSAVISANGLHQDSVNRVGVYADTLIPKGIANSWALGTVLAKESVAIVLYSRTSSRVYPIKYSGNFVNVTNKFLPLKFNNNGNTYYGWARLTTNAAQQLTIVDYAYNSIPDSAIASGNTGCNFAPITPVVTEQGDTLHSTSANKYQWFFTGTPIPGDTLSVVTPPQQGYYAVLTTDANGCLSESVAYYFSAPPCYYGVQPIVSEISGFSNPSCVPVLLQADNLVSGTYVQWLNNGATIIGATARTYMADSSGNYSAQFIDSDKTCYVISDTVQLAINQQVPDPVLSTNNQSTVLCQGAVFNISLTDSADYSPADTLQWYLNGTSILAANKPVYSIDTSGAYFLSITSNGACYKYSDTLIITEDIQHPTINPLGKDTLMTQRYTSYQWYKDGVQVSGGTGQYYTPTDSGAYYVIVTDSSGCSFKSPGYYFISTGISSAILPEQVSVYSYNKIVHVLFTDENMLGSALRIYNTLGQEIFSATLSTGQTEIDMNDFASGLYIVEVDGKASPVIKKIVIE